MITKISDFKLAEFLLRAFCKMGKTTFVDLPILFTESPATYNGISLVIQKHDKLNKTCFAIIGTYVSHSDIISSTPPEITSEDKLQFLTMAVAALRDITYSSESTTSDIKGTVALKMNRIPFIWILMRDVICPAYNRPIKNIPVLIGRSGLMDGAKYVEEGVGNIAEPLVFSNLEIDNPHCRDAYLLFECLRAHDLNPTAVLTDIFNKPELSGKMIGLSKAAHVSLSAINDFLMTLCMLANYKATDDVLIHEAKSKWVTKSGLWAQAQAQSMWWYFGLIEKMLDPSRGPDWTGYFNTKPFMDDLWERVETEKKRRNLPELPLELLLRVQSEEFKQRTDLTIEQLLADNRVW